MRRLKKCIKNQENEEEYLHNEDTQGVSGVIGKWGREIRNNNKLVIKVKQSRYRPRVAQRVPGS